MAKKRKPSGPNSPLGRLKAKLNKPKEVRNVSLLDPERECGINVGTEGHIDHGPKGQKGGRCNVTSCQKPGAVFQNVGMISTGGSWYCRSCASDINMVNQRDVENGCEFTLFPEFNKVLARYKELRRGGKDPHDISLYDDIDQNPWGSCYHFDRDKEKSRECTE